MPQTNSPGAVARAEAGDCFAEQQAVPDTTPASRAPARRPNGPAAYRHWRSVDAGPTARELKILHRIAVGGLYVTHRNGGISRSFEDGAPVSRADFEKFVELRWIHPDADAPALIPGMAAQRYLVGARWLR